MSEALHEFREAYERSFVQMDLQAALVDASGRIVLATDTLAAQLLHEPESLRSAALDTIFSPRNPAWLSREIRAAASSGVWTGDAILKNADGTEWWAHIQACRAPNLPGAEGELLLQVEDVTERIEITTALMKRAEELYDRNSELEIIGKVGKLLLANTDLESRLNAVLREAAQSIQANTGMFFIKDRSTDRLACRAVCGEMAPTTAIGFQVELDQPSLAAYAVRTRQTQSIKDVSAEENVLREAARSLGVKSALGVPMIACDEAFGALLLGSNRTRSFSSEEIVLVEIITNHAAFAIYNSFLGEDVALSRAWCQRASRLASVGEMLAGASHSFGNVLMALQGTVESARAAALGSAPKEEVVGKLERAAEHVNRGSEIIRRLLSFSQGVEEAPKGVTLHDTVEAAIELCRTHPAARHRAITDAVPCDLPLVEARPGPLQEVVLNLVLNALQATGPNGEVRVEAEVDESEPCVYLRVIDNGFGMSPETASQAFEPFFSTKGGTGLGLPTSAAAIHRMGGLITVDSRLGEGTTFTVRLNLKNQATSTDQQAA